jgi:hypothetical protein
MHCGAEVTESSTNKQHHHQWKLLKLQKLRNSCGNFRNYTTFFGKAKYVEKSRKREKRILKKEKGNM